MPLRSVTLLLAIACGLAVSTIYAGQPLLVTIGAELAIGAGTLGLIVTITQVGYGVGLVLLVPLGDLVDRRRLIVTQLVLLAAALLVVAAAGTAALLLAGLAAVGLLAVAVQTMVAYAATLADTASGTPASGRIIGAVTSGVVIGILLARTVSGVLADIAGWRAAYLVWAVALLGIAVAAHRMLDRRDPPAPAVRYGALLRSMVRLFVDEPLFRSRALLALFVFAAFSTLWSALALPLSAPPLALGNAAIGAFGLAGVAGALAAIPAGRLADRGRAQLTTGVALTLLVLSWLPIAIGTDVLWLLAIGIVVLDLAVQAVHVSNQSLIVALRPDAGSRLIAGYMVCYSIGSGLGAMAATALYAAAGWIGVCLLGAAFSTLALMTWAVTRRCRTATAPVRTRAGRSAP